MNTRTFAKCFVILTMLSLLAACDGGGTPGSSATAITAQPTDQSVVTGTTATFNVVASNANGYQWQSSTDGGASFIAVAGATSTSYTTPVTTLADTGMQYRVVVTGASNSVTSSAVTLTVTPVIVAPAISVQPAGQAITAGQDASFSATASGTAPAYQWQRSTDGGASFADLAGQNNATLTRTAVPVTDNGHQFRVMVSNSAGSVTSNAALLTVNAAQSTPAFTTHPASISVLAPNTATFSVVVTGSPGPTLQWQLSTNGGGSFADIAGATGSSYTTPATAAGDNGNQYRVTATNGSGTTTSNAATITVTVLSAPGFSTQPVSATISEGQSAQFTVGVSGTPTPTLQWQLSTDSGANWSNINGETGAVFTVLNAALANNGRQFRAVASNSEGTVNSNAAILTVTAAAPASTSSYKVAATFNNSCAVKSDATLSCWGYNSSGQLGSGNLNSYSVPNPVAGLTGVTAVATGRNETCAIHGGGNLSCWGNTSVLLPVAVAGYSGVQAVAVGAMHKCFVTSTGNVRCLGNNSAGQLGDGSTTNSTTPVLVYAAGNAASLSNVVALAAGYAHTCALIADGSVLCWGAVTATNSAVPMPVVSNAVTIAAGEGAPCVVLADGTVQCWAGTGTLPQTVAGVNGVTSLAVGSQHACAVLVDARVKCWGTGLMGNGNVSETQPTPQFVAGLTGATTLAAGFQHTCVLRNNRSMVCWGANGAGQLGTGDLAGRTTPTDVLGGASFWGP